jgi:hydrogenase expression/formation protein HypC
MCLSVPGQVTEIFRDGDILMGKVSFGGIARGVCLEHVPEVSVGEYVLVHVGFALARLDEAEARRVLAELEALGEAADPEANP